MTYNDHPLLMKGKEAKHLRAEELKRTPTEAERILWSRLRHNSLQGIHFRQQVVIRGFIVDFYCNEARLIIEVDGGVHDQQQAYDEERDAILKSHGYRIIRFSNETVRTRLRHVMITILDTIRS